MEIVSVGVPIGFTRNNRLRSRLGLRNAEVRDSTPVDSTNPPFHQALTRPRRSFALCGTCEAQNRVRPNKREALA